MGGGRLGTTEYLLFFFWGGGGGCTGGSVAGRLRDARVCATALYVGLVVPCMARVGGFYCLMGTLVRTTCSDQALAPTRSPPEQSNIYPSWRSLRCTCPAHRQPALAVVPGLCPPRFLGGKRTVWSRHPRVRVRCGLTPAWLRPVPPTGQSGQKPGCLPRNTSAQYPFKRIPLVCSRPAAHPSTSAFAAPTNASARPWGASSCKSGATGMMPPGLSGKSDPK